MDRIGVVMYAVNKLEMKKVDYIRLKLIEQKGKYEPNN